MASRDGGNCRRLFVDLQRQFQLHDARRDDRQERRLALTTLEALAGLEYNDRCWALRVVAHRFATTTSAASTSLFIQLELNGVSRIGTNPLEVLQRNIAGYKQLDPRGAPPVEYNMPGLF